MALQLPPGGRTASQNLARQLAKLQGDLRTRYANLDPLPQAAGQGSWDDYLRDLQAYPGPAQVPGGGLMFGNPDPAAWAKVAGVAPPAGAAADPYGTEGWDERGVNRYNPSLARGDMPAPGPVGVGPGFWTRDEYGTPFWRSDWEWKNGQWVIRGSG